MIDGNDIFVSLTVLLETNWVLRSVFNYRTPQLAQALRAFGGLSNVTIEDAIIAARALDWLENAMDFADALHLAKAAGCEAFVTFDRNLIRAAQAQNTLPARLP